MNAPPKMPPFVDTHRLTESERIQIIASQINLRKLVGVVIDDDDAKVERYLRKLQTHCPEVQVYKRIKGPVTGVVTLQLGLPGVKAS